MSNIFVTGVAGFLGSHVAEEMLCLGHNVAGNDNMIGGEYANVPLGVMLYADDCNSFGLMKDAIGRHKTEVLYHCAATAYEGLSVFSPAIVTKHIVGASVATFSAAIAAGVKRIVHCSSMARYGTNETPFRETYACKPQDPYGIGKFCAEQMLKNLCEVHGVEYVIAVPHNIIGPRQKYDDPFRNVVAIMINRCLQGKPPIIYGDGTQRRCFSFVGDCLQCLIKMGFQEHLSGEVINIGPDEGSVTINELAEKVMDVTGFNGFPILMPGRPQEVKFATCSSDKARWLLGYKTTTTLDQGLQEMVEFIRRKGPKPFNYHLPIEIVSEKTPKTWTEKLF